MRRDLFKPFSYIVLQFDITWIEDESLADLDNLPKPEVLTERDNKQSEYCTKSFSKNTRMKGVLAMRTLF